MHAQRKSLNYFHFEKVTKSGKVNKHRFFHIKLTEQNDEADLIEIDLITEQLVAGEI
jgi:hypothetical protein